MATLGSDERPLRVAVIGSGPAGFYTVQALVQNRDRPDLRVEIDILERLWTPFGLVRHGVAPDHQRIKAVTAVYEKLAAHDDVAFLGGVGFGDALGLEDLERHYDQVVFCCGAETDRRLGIEGEDLAGSHPATEFVAWFNGHPDYCDHAFDLSCERAVVVGVGNVAVDVARVLTRDVDELATTDIADHALEALRASRIREVVLLGRRGPAQSAFTNQEVKELGELAGVCARTEADEMLLDPGTVESLGPDGPDRTLQRKLDILSAMVGREPRPGERTLSIRFRVSPARILGDGAGRVRAVELEHNELVLEGGRLQARPSGRTSTIDAGLVFRSVGYRGVPLPGVPFRDDRGIVPNDRGRVLDAPGGRPRTGLYVAGWIKRGPSGVIGTNKPDAAETVACMLEDLDAGRTLAPSDPTREGLLARLRERGVRPRSYEDWQRIDEEERRRGEAGGRPRVKFVRRDDLAGFLGDT